MPRRNQMSQNFWFLVLITVWHNKRLSRACTNVLIRQSHGCSHTQRIGVDQVPNQNLDPLSQHWSISDIVSNIMYCSKSSVEHIFMIKVIIYPNGMNLILLLLSSIIWGEVFSIWYAISYIIYIRQMTGEELLYQYLTFIMISFTM